MGVPHSALVEVLSAFTRKTRYCQNIVLLTPGSHFFWVLFLLRLFWKFVRHRYLETLYPDPLQKPLYGLVSQLSKRCRAVPTQDARIIEGAEYGSGIDDTQPGVLLHADAGDIGLQTRYNH